MTDENQTTTVWGIHATEEPRLLIERNCIALGWEKIGDLSDMPRDRDGFKYRYAELREEYGESKQAVANAAGQLLRFAWEAKVGDVAVYPVPGSQDVWIGRISGPYRHTPDAILYNQQRDVEWIGNWPRSSFSPGAQSALGTLMTFWKMGAFAGEFLERIGLDATASEKTREQIVLERLYTLFDGRGFEYFVADLFRLYGYEVEVTPRTGDHGVDLVARANDGILSRTVKAQVKRLNSRVTEACVQQLRGTLDEGELGVVVSYAGLGVAAKKFAARHGIVAIDGERLRDLALQHEAELSKKWLELFPPMRTP